MFRGAFFTTLEIERAANAECGKFRVNRAHGSLLHCDEHAGDYKPDMTG
jgi:hypothetical protein